MFWSGIAAGLLISLSVLGEAILRTHFRDVAWRHLIENLGYSLGYLVVILGRMQLFTENTITTVLPVMAQPTRAHFSCRARLWTVVLAVNVIGAFAAGAVLAPTSAVPETQHPAIAELSRHATGWTPWPVSCAQSLPASWSRPSSACCPRPKVPNAG